MPVFPKYVRGKQALLDIWDVIKYEKSLSSLQRVLLVTNIFSCKYSIFHLWTKQLISSLWISHLCYLQVARTWANNLISGPQIKKHEQCPLVIFKIWAITLLQGHNKYFYKIKWNWLKLNRKYRGLAFVLSHFSCV